MAKISQEFKKKVAEYDMDSSAKSHLDAWASRYMGKSKKDVQFDLYVNHDNDAEVEKFTEWLGKDITNDEHEYVKDQFIKSVVKNYKRSNY